MPLSARLGEDEASGADYSEAIALSRLGWAALAVGTSHAVLDYVIPYVREREAFGEPVARRQAVAFMCANIAIELDGLRLITWRGAAAPNTAAVRAGGRAGRKLGTDKGMQIGLDGVQLLGGHGTQGAPGRTLVPRSAGHRRRRGRPGPLNPCVGGSRLSAINLEMPRPWKSRHREGPPGRREMLRPIAQVRPGRACPTRSSSTPGPRCSRASRRATPSVRRHRGVPRQRPGPGETSTAATCPRCSALEIAWGDIARAALSVPRRGLGNAAISGVATDRRATRAAGPQRLGGDGDHRTVVRLGLAVSTTAVLDGDEYVINGEKIYVTAGSRAPIVVWATLDKSKGRAAIKSFIVPREHPGVTVERLEHKLGIKASDTAAIRFDNVRIPKENLLGSPDIEVEKGFAGVMETFDNTRPIVAMAMAVAWPAPPWRSCGRSSPRPGGDLLRQARARARARRPRSSYAWRPTGSRLPADRALGVAGRQRHPELRGLDGEGQGRPGGQRHHAEGGRDGRYHRLFRADAAGEVGRDSKILDIFEGTQQIQQLVVARRLLGLSSTELK